MASSFSWLDFSESDRQQTMQVLDLFREKNTLDELGFGPIRDAFADHFFPGTSTIQTRARYFLFVPWILRRLEKKGEDSAEFLASVRRQESKLINALLAGDPTQFGVIGKEAKATLKRMPSAVYWRGLKLWGIRLSDGSIEQHAREVERRRRHGKDAIFTDDGEAVHAQPELWNPGLPASPEVFLESTTFLLTENESAFLKQQICLHQPQSALAQLLVASQSPIESDWIWDPQLASCFSVETRHIIEHARCFAACALGATLLYTRMVAVMKQGCEELVNTADEQLLNWQSRLEADAEALHNWDLNKFWLLIQKMDQRPAASAIQFVEEWIAVSREVANGATVWNEARVQKLIRDRESRLKGPRSRLRTENVRGRDRWQGNVSSGLMDYRWSQSRLILNDILRGPAEPALAKAHMSGDINA